MQVYSERQGSLACFSPWSCKELDTTEQLNNNNNNNNKCRFIRESVQFSRSAVSDSLCHARLPCLSPTPRACSDSCPLTQWCHPTISSCHPLLLQPSIFPSIRVFSNESVLCIRWPKYWSFSSSISPSNEYQGANSKERQSQRMLKLPHSCTHFTRWETNAQNSPSQAAALCEPWTSRCLSWF